MCTEASGPEMTGALRSLVGNVELLSTIIAPYAGLYSNSYLTQDFHRVAQKRLQGFFIAQDR